MDKHWIESLETPAVVVDMGVVKRNIARMQAAADARGVQLRPHIKTHKMPELARLQMEAGAVGITCAKVSEAEVMADAGLDDIFIAYPMVGRLRAERTAALGKRVRRLIVCVDSAAGARLLSDAAQKAGVRLEVRLEIDTGKRRTGVSMDGAAALARQIAQMPGLEVSGIFTFKSLTLGGASTQDGRAAANEEGALMAEAARAIRAAGIALKDISGGSTPTGILAADTGLLTEIRPGTYIYNDAMMLRDGVAQAQDLAVRIYATVVSVAPDHAVIDGGSKTFPMDVPVNAPPYFFPASALIEGRDDLYIDRMNEEHGVVVRRGGGDTGLLVGEVIALVPVHVCTAVNMHNTVYLYEDGALKKSPIAARGMLF